MDRVNGVTKYRSNDMTQGAIQNKKIKPLVYTNGYLYHVWFVWSEIEYKEPTMVGLFNLQCAKLGKLEL